MGEAAKTFGVENKPELLPVIFTGVSDMLVSSLAVNICHHRVLRGVNKYSPVCACVRARVQGCKMRDHIVSVPSEEGCDEATSAQVRVLNDLLLHRDAVCLSNSSPVDR